MNAKEFFDKTIENPLTIEQLMEQYAEHRLLTQQLWGVIDEFDRIISVHRTEEGAKKNRILWGRPEWNVDVITIHP